VKWSFEPMMSMKMAEDPIAAADREIRDKALFANQELLARLEAVKILLAEIPVFTMPFINAEPDAVSEYLEKMTSWEEQIRAAAEGLDNPGEGM